VVVTNYAVTDDRGCWSPRDKEIL